MEINELMSVRDAFLREMQNASKGLKTSLPYIKHSLSSGSLVQTGDQFQVIIIGGSLYVTALLRKTPNGLDVIERVQGNLPAFHSKIIFLEFIESILKPHIRVLALNFAYALNPVFLQGILDGELVLGAKEHVFEGLIGQKVGQTISAHYKQKYNRTLQVAVANDTICLLLSGLRDHTWDEIACGIVGTGLNFAFFEDKNTAVNLESGEFNVFALSETAKEIDAQSSSPGGGLLEKETSGAYLFEKYNRETRSQQLKTPEITGTVDLDTIVQDKNHPGNKIAEKIMERSAQCTAFQVSAIMEYQRNSLTFLMTGSLFWKAQGYKDRVEKNVRELSPTLKATFVKNEDGELYGTAMLVA